jgi:hypothetical protein
MSMPSEKTFPHVEPERLPIQSALPTMKARVASASARVSVGRPTMV